MVDPTTITPGSDFGPRYRIETLLGQGGMGRVYKAHDKELNRTVAIKVVRQGAMGETDALSRFKQELVLASKISHKNILRIHDLGEVDGMKFITMAYVEGHDLHQIIKDNPKLPLERVLKFAVAACGGACGRACRGCSPSRFETAKYLGGQGRSSLHLRFRPREILRGRRYRHDAIWSPTGHSALHVAGTGRRQANRRALGHLLLRFDSLRDGDGRRPLYRGLHTWGDVSTH